MTKTLRPHNLKLVIEWFELEDDAYPDVGLPLGVTVFVELQVEPDSAFTVMKNVSDVINLESAWHKGVVKIADRPPQTSVEDPFVEPSSPEIGEDDYPETQGDLYAADDIDESETESEVESVASSTRSSVTVRPFTTTTKPSKIPVRKHGLDGSFDDLDLEIDIPPSPTLSAEDSLPWHSTKEAEDYMEENGQTGIDIDDLFTDLDDIYQPFLRVENGDIVLHAAREVEPGFYRVEVAFYRHFTQEDQGWWGVDLSDVIETCPPIPGKMVFNLQSHPSLITQIVGPDDLHYVDDSEEASFDPREKPYLAFWAWTHATYLEFWGERDADETYYDDLIAPNAYLDSDELVDYVEFMYKTRDDDDVYPENLNTPESKSKGNHYMSPIAEEEEYEDDQADNTIHEDVTGLDVEDVVGTPEEGSDLPSAEEEESEDDITALNVGNAISDSEECSTTHVSEEDEWEDEEDEDVVWEDVSIPNVDNVVLGSEERSTSSSTEEEVEDTIPEDTIVLNDDNGMSTSEERPMTPPIDEEAEDTILEDITAVHVENVSLNPEECSVTPPVEEKAEEIAPEDVTAPNADNVVCESEEDDLRFGGLFHPPPEPIPDYAETIEWHEKYRAMIAAQAAFRRRVLFFLHRILPVLFVLILTICACINGPPVTISTPTNTLHTVKYYANHLGEMGYSALKNVDFRLSERERFARETIYTPTTSPERGKETEDFSDVEGCFVWKMVDETLDRAGIAVCPTVFESAEPTTEIESVVSPSALDAETSPSPPELAAEVTTAISTTSISSADITMPPNPEITSTLDHPPPTTPPTETNSAVLSLAIKEDFSHRLCPSPHHPNYANRHINCPPHPSASEPALTQLAGWAKGVLRHIACSTSPICTISRISDKYEPPWEIFPRFRCDGKGGWKPDTGRDVFDRFMGWMPAECKIGV